MDLEAALQATAEWVEEKRFEIKTADSVLFTGPKFGGPDDPSPVEYLAASLAGCVGHFVAKFLGRRGGEPAPYRRFRHRRGPAERACAGASGSGETRGGNLHRPPYASAPAEDDFHLQCPSLNRMDTGPQSVQNADV
jgi:hypothetical protein